MGGDMQQPTQHGVSDFERERQERMQRNKAVLAGLMNGADTSLLKKPVNRPRPKPAVIRRRIDTPLEPARRSGRIQNLPAKNYQVDIVDRAPKRQKLGSASKATQRRSSVSGVGSRCQLGTARCRGGGYALVLAPSGWEPACGQASDAAAAAAEAAALQLVEELEGQGKHGFIKPMSPSQVSGGFWSQAPRPLSAHWEHLSTDVLITMRCQDATYPPHTFRYFKEQRCGWEVVWHPKPDGGGVGFSGGWRGFAIDQRLHPNDAVVFEPVTDRELLVHIFRAVDYETEATRPFGQAPAAWYSSALQRYVAGEEMEEDSEAEQQEEEEEGGEDEEGEKELEEGGAASDADEDIAQGVPEAGSADMESDVQDAQVCVVAGGSGRRKRPPAPAAAAAGRDQDRAKAAEKPSRRRRPTQAAAAKAGGGGEGGGSGTSADWAPPTPQTAGDAGRSGQQDQDQQQQKGVPVDAVQQQEEEEEEEEVWGGGVQQQAPGGPGEDGEEEDEGEDVYYQLALQRSKEQGLPRPTAAERRRAAGGEEFSVEFIQDFKVIEGQRLYLVRWLGYGPAWDLWTPEGDLYAPPRGFPWTCPIPQDVPGAKRAAGGKQRRQRTTA